MPEGPELHLASLFVNRVCQGVVFTGPVRKSEVNKNPEVPFTCVAYRITATSRGKEVKLTLTPIKSDDEKLSVTAGQTVQPMDIVFRFGMSGFFRFTTEDELPKHAHLRFYTDDKPCRVLSFVDARRFGSWQADGTWQADRGPCVMFEYKSFRENVLSHLSDRAFDRPICEVLLNQKYFNGIGNYLRAEILHRLNILPFVPARSVLEDLQKLEEENEIKEETVDTKTFDRKKKVKTETADLISLCHTVPLEVVNLGGKGYDPEKADYSDFQAWLRCYYVDGMKSLRDHNGRTMWFSGDPGPMAPKESKSKAKKRPQKDGDRNSTSKKKVAKSSIATEQASKKRTATAKLNKEKKTPRKEAQSTRGKSARNGKETNTSQDKKRPRTRKKNNGSETTAVVRRSERATRRSSR